MIVRGIRSNLFLCMLMDYLASKEVVHVSTNGLRRVWNDMSVEAAGKLIKSGLMSWVSTPAVCMY